jgi:hypothetical protein
MSLSFRPFPENRFTIGCDLSKRDYSVGGITISMVGNMVEPVPNGSLRGTPSL